MEGRRPTHGGLRHIALNTRALEEMRRFYVEILGFHIEWQPDEDNIYLTSGTDNLALHRAPADAGMAESRAGFERLDHLGIVVKTAADVDAWAVYLEQAGVTIDRPPRTHRDGARSLYFRDPDGNHVQVIHHPPISERI